MRNPLLPRQCRYTPADLLPRSTDCQVIDLNQGQSPSGQYDVVVLADVLEFIHDVPALLRRSRQSASRLIATYNARSGQDIGQRRQQGWFNDYAEDELLAIFAQCGWHVETKHSTSWGLLLVSRGDVLGQ
jgi:hypothetical protein